jgi:hypothetical protein
MNGEINQSSSVNTTICNYTAVIPIHTTTITRMTNDTLVPSDGDVEASRLLGMTTATPQYGTTTKNNNDEAHDAPEAPNDSVYPNNNDGYHPYPFLSEVCTWIRNVYSTHDFPIHVIGAIGIAKAFPLLGAEILKPHITGE